MKIFVLGVPHTQTRRDVCICPFTAKAWLQCKMFRQLGHEVIHIGVEGSDPPCSENVEAVSRDEWSSACLLSDGSFNINPPAAYQEQWAGRVRQAILSRVKWPREAIVCCTWGGAQIAATQDIKQFVVESGIGYQRTWAKFRVFVSYAWLHFHLGRENRVAGDAWYDVVIPNAVDPELFDFTAKARGDELLFLGRLTDDKGVSIAIEVAKHAGRRLTIAGPGDPAKWLKDQSHVRHLPVVGIEERRKLLAEAAALICPTRYVEPLGNVAIEAQMSGTPVISTDWGGFTETVLHGITGYRCRTLDHFVWAAKNIDRIDRATCHQWAEQNYSPKRIAPMFGEYFQMLADLNAGGWRHDRPSRQGLRWLKYELPRGISER